PPSTRWWRWWTAGSGKRRSDPAMELKGIGVSPGIAIGPALIVEREETPVFRLRLPPEAVEAEVLRLERAVALSRQQLQAIKERLTREVGAPHAYIFDA